MGSFSNEELDEDDSTITATSNSSGESAVTPQGLQPPAVG